MWRDEMGKLGGWDAGPCTTLINEQDTTVCECSEFGTYAIMAELVKAPEYPENFQWLKAVHFMGYVVSIFLLGSLVFILVTNR
jgi:hypothetical protein